MRHLFVLLATAPDIAAGAAAATGAACSSSFPGDLKVESCAKFCAEKSAGAHCPRCQCRACSFCSGASKSKAPPPPPAACESGLAGDHKVESCSKFCTEKSAASHCPRCDCRSCPFCQALSKKGGSKSGGHGGSSSGGSHGGKGSSSLVLPTSKAPGAFDFYCSKASCDKFCSAEQRGHHCFDCKCKACDFCASTKCDAPACDAFCDPSFKKAQCAPGDRTLG